MKYRKSWGLADKIFSKEEVLLLKEKAEGFKTEIIAYCSFENRYAKSGGLGAVTKVVLPELDSFKNGVKAILITPFYPSIIFNKDFFESKVSFDFMFNGKNVFVEVFENIINYTQPKPGFYKEYYLKIDGFFEPVNNFSDPYLYYENNNAKNDTALRINSLVFSKAVAVFLNKMKLTKNILLHLQEWQTALLSLTVKEAMIEGFLESVFTTQTMHNPYDSFFEWKKLSLISKKINFKTIAVIEKYYGQKLDGLTSYQLALELADSPLSTVSKNFAEELTTDILQKEHFTPHLQKIFSINKITGVNNGLFEVFPEVYKNFNSLTGFNIEEIKNKIRKNFLEIIDRIDKAKTLGELTYENKSITGLQDDIPIFTMSGRVDFNQKGYDVFLDALKYFKKDEIKVIVTPLGAGVKEYAYFKNAAEHCRGNLLIISGRMEKGFNELRMGSSFGIMPSIYEPFGAAVEYFVAGTVVIARKTGGLSDQIDDKKNGFLWREKYKYTIDDIEKYTALKNDPLGRTESAWFTDMSETLYKTLKNAIKFYKNKKLYYNMIIEGFKKATEFGWNKSVKEYFEIYEYINKF